MPARRSRKVASVRRKKGGTPVRVRMYRSGLGDCFLITFDPGAKRSTC
jgi:hypothetical protein